MADTTVITSPEDNAAALAVIEGTAFADTEVGLLQQLFVALAVA